MFTGCSAFESPNSSLGVPGTASVTSGDWKVEARGEFLGGGRVEIQVDLAIKKVGDPTRTIVSPSVLTVVGQDAVISTGDNGTDTTCSISTTRDGSRVVVTVAVIISQGGRTVSKPMLRFVME